MLPQNANTFIVKNYLIALSQYINNPRANYIHLIDCLSLRFRKKNWMVSIKALLMTHYLMNQKNPVFFNLTDIYDASLQKNLSFRNRRIYRQLKHVLYCYFLNSRRYESPRDYLRQIFKHKIRNL